MLQPYEILLRWNDKGEFSGGHTIRRDSVTGVLTTALPIGVDKEFKWPVILGEVNAALAEKAAEVPTLQAKLDELQDKLNNPPETPASVEPPVPVVPLSSTTFSL